MYTRYGRSLIDTVNKGSTNGQIHLTPVTGFDVVVSVDFGGLWSFGRVFILPKCGTKHIFENLFHHCYREHCIDILYIYTYEVKIS